MSNEKPKMMWHADADGRCHKECEAWGPQYGHHGCKLLGATCWEVFDQPTPAKRTRCSFAVLADVLCLHRPPESDSAHCPRCGSGNYGADGSAMAVACWDCGFVLGQKEPEDRRCGTCADSDIGSTVCGWVMRCRAGLSVPFSIDQIDDGPPWPNCRFWRKR